MSLLRAFCFSFLAFCFAAPASAARLTPFYDFVDVPVVKPTSPQHVKAAIVNAALLQVWTIVENPDGSMTASMWKIREYDFKVRITYDANRYSIVYQDSQGLQRTSGYVEAMPSPVDRERVLENDEKLTQLARSLPEGPQAIKTDWYIHEAPNYWVRDLLKAIRRELAAPI